MYNIYYHKYMDFYGEALRGDTLVSFKDVDDISKKIDFRNNTIHKYAFAIPCPESLEIIKQYQPICEVGAGSGYWAAMLESIGTDIVACDTRTIKDNYYFKLNKVYYHKMKIVDPETFIPPKNRTLFLCWPPRGDDEMAFEYLQKYQGDTVIYIGEGEGGATATDSFFIELDDKWDLKDFFNIPQHNFIHDAMYIYTRKNNNHAI